MAKRRSFLSDATKYEFAKELGVADKVGNVPSFNNLGSGLSNFNYEFSDELGVSTSNNNSSLYFGNLSSKDCGNFVRLAIQKMERTMV